MLGTVRLKICISLLKLAPSNLLPNRYCLTLNIQKLADETAVVKNIQQGDFCQFLWPNFPFLKVLQIGLDSDALMRKGSKGQDMSWTASTLTILFQTMFTASSSRPTFLPRVWMAWWWDLVLLILQDQKESLNASTVMDPRIRHLSLT